jgi:CheY-like chemotaxis protein
MRVLVADDDFTSRTLVADVLRQEGYDVVAVADGAQADAALRETTPPKSPF